MTSTVGECISALLSNELAVAILKTLVSQLGELSDKNVNALTKEEQTTCTTRVGVYLSTFLKDKARATTLKSAFESNFNPVKGHNGVLDSLALARKALKVVIEDSEIAISTANDIVTARMNAREMAMEVGFSKTVSTEIATAVSELARNIILYAKVGKIEVRVLSREKHKKAGIEVKAIDHGPGIPSVDEVMSTTYKSVQGLGLGLKGVKRLMDSFEIETKPDRGTKVTIQKWL